MKRVYNAKQHPDVLSGKSSEDEILCDFLDTFEAHYVELHGSKTKDRRIELNEWLEYYNHVSSNIDSDDYFEQMIVKAYGL